MFVFQQKGLSEFKTIFQLIVLPVALKQVLRMQINDVTVVFPLVRRCQCLCIQGVLWCLHVPVYLDDVIECLRSETGYCEFHCKYYITVLDDN